MRCLTPRLCTASAEQPRQAPRSAPLPRRSLLVGTGAALLALDQGVGPAAAIQGLVPGRIPGLAKEADADGFRFYSRPLGKSGGHGVGWSEIPPYSFLAAPGFDEVPTSIADLGGAEVDLRFSNPSAGNVSVVVAPVARFADIGFNADVKLEELIKPEQLIAGFAPELIGVPLQEGDVLSTATPRKNGLLFYEYELKSSRVPHLLVSATAHKNRLYILSCAATSRQWRNAEADLRRMAFSFAVTV
jgi:hypothetical protein